MQKTVTKVMKRTTGGDSNVYQSKYSSNSGSRPVVKTTKIVTTTTTETNGIGGQDFGDIQEYQGGEEFGVVNRSSAYKKVAPSNSNRLGSKGPIKTLNKNMSYNKEVKA